MKISIRWPLIIGFLTLIWITHFILIPPLQPSTEIKPIEIARRTLSPLATHAHHHDLFWMEPYLIGQLQMTPALLAIRIGFPDDTFIRVDRLMKEGKEEFHSKVITRDQNEKLRTRLTKWNQDHNILETKKVDNAVTLATKESWYLAAHEKKTVVRMVIDDHLTNGKKKETVSNPIYGNNRDFLGVLALDIMLSPQNEKPFPHLKSSNGFLMIVLSFFATALALLLSYGITRPLASLKKEAQAISKLDFSMDLKSPPSTYKEIRAISDTFSLLKKSIRVAQKRFQNIFEHIQDIYFETTYDGTLVEISPSIRQYLSYTREEIIGERTDTFFYNPNDRKDYVTALERDGMVKDYEISISDKDGSRHFFSLSAVIVRDKKGDPKKVIGSMRDISDRKKVDQELDKYRTDLEQLVKKRTNALEAANQELLNEIKNRQRTEIALRDSEEKYRTILENILEAYIEIDRNGKITFVNDATCKMVGYSREHLIGKNNKQIISKETADETDRILKKIYATGKSRQINNFTIVTKESEKIILEVSLSPIKGPDNEAIGFRCMGRDITFRIEAEKERKMLENQLHQAQRLEAIGTLAGGIAHDFNNLLMGIQGNLSLLYLNIEDDSPFYENLKTIENCVDSGANLTRQLLGFARGGKYVVTTVEINKIVQNTSSLFGRTKKEIRLHGNYQKNLWNVKADRSQIEQVLVNIYVNAWQAMPQGNGDIYLQTENVILGEKFVKAYDVKAGKYVKISIKDSGIGMEEDTKQRIFEPFFTTKKLGRGTGLGLASAFGIIKNHGGIIDVESTPSIGTTFFIYLPASSKLIVKKDEKPDVPLSGNESILVVDDESFILKSLKDMLGDLGYTIYTANGGNEAIEIFKKNKEGIDLVILDMIMPDLGGKETFEILKEVRPSIKILLSSGYSINNIAEDILKQGCDGFIQKPVNIAILSRKIRQILDK